MAFDGLPHGQLCYGRMLLEGTGVSKDPVAALMWFRRAASSGDLDAINMVGRCLDNGWGTPKTLARPQISIDPPPLPVTPGRNTSWVTCTWRAVACSVIFNELIHTICWPRSRVMSGR